MKKKSMRKMRKFRMQSGVRSFEVYGRDHGYQPLIIREGFVYEEMMEYKLDSIPIGVNTHTKEVYYLNLKGGQKTGNHIFVCGGTGSGKSTLLQGMVDRSAKAGASVFMIDIKGEFIQKYKPLQSDMRDFLKGTEKEEGMDIASYYPLFFTQSTMHKLDEQEHFIQFSFEDINKGDFLTMLMKDDRDMMARDFVNLHWHEIVRASNVDEMMSIVDKSDFATTTKDVLKRKLEELFKSRIIGTETGEANIIDMLNNDIMVNLNLEGIESFKSLENYVSAYISILLRKIYSSKTDTKSRDPRSIIPRSKIVILMLDELNTYYKKYTKGATNEVIEEIIDKGRTFNLCVWGSSQDYKRIPPTLIEQARYIMISNRAEMDTVKELLKQSLPQLYDRYSFSNTVANIMAMVKRYDWLVIDRDRGRYDIIRAFVPLSRYG